MRKFKNLVREIDSLKRKIAFRRQRIAEDTENIEMLTPELEHKEALLLRLQAEDFEREMSNGNKD